MRKAKAEIRILKVIIYMFLFVMCFFTFFYRGKDIELQSDSTSIIAFCVSAISIYLSMWYRWKDQLEGEYQKPIKKAMKRGKTIYVVIISTDDKDKEKNRAQWIQLPK